MLLDARPSFDSSSVSNLRLTCKALSSIGNKFRTSLHFASDNWDGERQLLRELHDLLSVSIKFPSGYQKSDLHNCLSELFNLQPLLTSLSLQCDSLPYLNPYLNMTLGPQVVRWGDTLQCLVVRNVNVGTMENGTKIDTCKGKGDETAWGFLSECAALTSFAAQGTSPPMRPEDIMACKGLRQLRLKGGKILSADTLSLIGCIHLRELVCHKLMIKALNLEGLQELEVVTCADNSLSELDMSSCAALIQLECSHNSLTKIDLSACTALKQLKCACNSLPELDLSASEKLEVLDCSMNKILGLDLTMCRGLTKLRYIYNWGPTPLLNLAQCNKLQSLDVKHVRLGGHSMYGPHLPLYEDLTTLRLVYVSGIYFDLKFSLFPSLQSLHLSGGKGRVIDAADCPFLTDIECIGNYFTNILLVGGCPLLHTLDVQECPLQELDVGGCTGMKRIKCHQCCHMNSVDLSSCTSLQEVWFASDPFPITSLDMSFCASSLEKLSCIGLLALKSLSLAGCSKLVDLNCSECLSLEAVNCKGCSGLDEHALLFEGCGRFNNMTVCQVLALED